MRPSWHIPAVLILAPALLCAAAAHAAENPIHEAQLTPGWDIFNVALGQGKVKWSVGYDEEGQKRFSASFELTGAQPNHSYTVGAHFFEPQGMSVKRVTRFGGWKIGDTRGELSRDGVTATSVGGWDFAILNTDAQGNGTAEFESYIPEQDYHLQFTVRMGRCRPAQGVTDGCGAVFRTGGKLGQAFEVIRAKAQPAVKTNVTALTPGWDIFDAPLRQGQVQWSAGDADAGRRHFTARFELKGAQPKHSYTVGAHFFEPRGKSVKTVTQFGGWKVGDTRGDLSRDGVTATSVGGWDFGVLTTDERGDGAFAFESFIPAEDYHMQFTVRTGRCRPAEGITDGCAAVFRSGGKLGQRFETIAGQD